MKKWNIFVDEFGQGHREIDKSGRWIKHSDFQKREQSWKNRVNVFRERIKRANESQVYAMNIAGDRLSKIYALKSEIERLKAENEELREYATHKDYCSAIDETMQGLDESKCNCGFSELQKEAD